MSNLLDQLYQTKLLLFAVISVVVGGLLLGLGRWVSQLSAPGWLIYLPLPELGSILVGMGLLAIGFEYFNRKQGDQRTDERLRHAIRQEAPAIRDAVLHSFAFDPAALKNVASAETLDRIAANALGLRLDDPALARDLYTDLRDQVVHAQERRHDERITVTLSPWEQGPTVGRGAMFVATFRWEYQVVPARSVVRFACVSDLTEYRELLQDPSITHVSYFEPISGLTGASPDAFELMQFTVDGRPQSIRRATRAGSQIATVHLKQRPDLAGEPATVAYTYRTLVQQHSHLLYLDIAEPTDGLQVEVFYGNCGIRYVNVLDFIASTHQPRVTHSPKAVPSPSAQVGFDGWVFPKSGVAFVWVLEIEMYDPEPSVA